MRQWSAAIWCRVGIAYLIYVILGLSLTPVPMVGGAHPTESLGDEPGFGCSIAWPGAIKKPREVDLIP